MLLDYRSAQGQCAGRCMTTRRLVVASLAGVATITRSKVAIRARPSPAAVAAARERLWAMTANCSQAAFAGKEVGHDAPLVQPAAGRLLVHERSQVARSSQFAQHGAQQPGLSGPGGMVEGQVGRVRTQAGFVAAIPFALLRPIPHKGAAPGFTDDQAEGGQPRIHLAGGRHGHAMAGREVAVRGHQRAGREQAGADVFGQPFSQQSNARGSHGV